MQVFPLACFRCGEPMRIIAFVTEGGSTRRILASLGEPTQAPRMPPAARGPPWQEHFDPREVDAVAMSEPVPSDELDQRVSWYALSRRKLPAGQGDLTGTNGLASAPGPRLSLTPQP